MRFVTDLSKGILGEPDSVEMWNEILSNIPDSFFQNKNIKILNVACGHGTEAKLLVKRMINLGWSKKEIQDSVFLLDKYKVFTNEVSKYGFTNIIKADFENWETDMKFDAIIMNPPYLKGTWVKFFDKAVSLKPKYIAQVSPDGTGNFSARSDKIEKSYIDNGIQIYKECTAYFPNVSSGKICYGIFDLDLPANKTCLEDTSINGEIVKKFINHNGMKVESKLSGKRTSKDIAAPRFDTYSDGLIRSIESVTKTGPVFKYINPENTTIVDGKKYWFVNRFFGKDVDATVVEVDDTIGFSHNVIAIERIKGVTVEDFKAVMLTKPKRFVLDVLRAGGFDTSPRHLRQLSFVDDSQIGLTSDEIAHIESHY